MADILKTLIHIFLYHSDDSILFSLFILLITKITLLLESHYGDGFISINNKITFVNDSFPKPYAEDPTYGA